MVLDISRLDVRSCPLCGGGGYETFTTEDLYLGVPGRFSMMRCRDCGAHWLRDPFGQADIHLAYPAQTYYSFTEPLPPSDDLRQNALRIRYGGRSTPLARLAAPFLHAYPTRPVAGSVLDVGCGAGARLARLSRAGWTAVGVEVFDSAVARAQRAGFNVHRASADHLPFTDDSFDAAVMSHSLEHLHDPRTALGEVRRVLRDGAELVIATPNTASLACWLFGRHWFGWEISRHLVLFDRSSLRRVLKEEGFEVRRMRGSSNGTTWVKSCVLAAKARGWRSRNPPRLVGLIALVWALALDLTPWADEIEVIATKAISERQDATQSATPEGT